MAVLTSDRFFGSVGIRNDGCGGSGAPGNASLCTRGTIIFGAGSSTVDIDVGCEGALWVDLCMVRGAGDFAN